jgi:uncharacterized Zn finger protein (UPF0148 family)
MNKLKNMQQLNGRVETKLDDVVMLRCDSPRCGQVHFAHEPGSSCPDCQKGSLEVVKMTNEQKKEKFLNRLNEICGEENAAKWLSTQHPAFNNFSPQELIEKNNWEPLEDIMAAMNKLSYE